MSSWGDDILALNTRMVTLLEVGNHAMTYLVINPTQQYGTKLYLIGLFSWSLSTSFLKIHNCSQFLLKMKFKITTLKRIHNNCSKFLQNEVRPLIKLIWPFQTNLKGRKYNWTRLICTVWGERCYLSKLE